MSKDAPKALKGCSTDVLRVYQGRLKVFQVYFRVVVPGLESPADFASHLF